MYREEIFCLEDASYKTVGEWLKSAMKTSGLKRADFVYNLNKDHGVGEPGKGIEPTFISAITAGREKIPERYIPAFCQSLGLSKPVARYYAAEILRVNLPVELKDFVIRSMKSARETAKSEYLENRVSDIEAQRVSAHQDCKDGLKWGLLKNHQDIDEFYDAAIKRTRQELLNPRASILKSVSCDVSLSESMHSALQGDAMALSVFFNQDFKPVSSMVAMARLYQFFVNNNKDPDVTFEEVIEAICLINVVNDNLSAFSWQSFLKVFLDKTNHYNQKKIDEILASESELNEALLFEQAKNWLCQREWQWIERKLIAFDIYTDRLDRLRNHFFEQYIKFHDEYGVYYFDAKVIRMYFSELPEEDYLEAIEFYESGLCEHWIDHTHIQEGFLSQFNIEGQVLSTDAYLSGWLKNYLAGGLKND
ncbi:hypothetical protein [Endozoicomonas sp. ISHI1]|uniref:hypothetical protein n=1 Tax=Endozoicomonas sp. ISHI1 TaxID=2825882 RepID=UPI002148CA05|nr:hypothetical protein [Endozoicomonas sp. ISHI1]